MLFLNKNIQYQWHLNISWARTHSLLTFECSWRFASSQQRASSQQASSSSSSRSSCRATEWGEAASPQLPARVRTSNYLHLGFKCYFVFVTLSLKAFLWMHSRQDTQLMVPATIEDPGHDKGQSRDSKSEITTLCSPSSTAANNTLNTFFRVLHRT